MLQTYHETIGSFILFASGLIGFVDRTCRELYLYPFTTKSALSKCKPEDIGAKFCLKKIIIFDIYICSERNNAGLGALGSRCQKR